MPSLNDQVLMPSLNDLNDLREGVVSSFQLVKFLPDQLRLMVSFHSDKKWEDLQTLLHHQT
jgi:hypothetical protein